VTGVMSRLRKRADLAGVLLVVVLIVALALRLKGVAWGLPYSFVNADESVVVPRAFAVARGHLDPRFFYYPSLYFYALGLVYVVGTPVLWLVRHGNPLAMGAFVVDPGPYFLLGRLLSAACGVASVYLVYRLGRVAFGRPAGLLAALFLAVVPLHVKYSHMAVTDVPATMLSLLALVLLLEVARGRGRRWLVAGAVVAGLATSTKYNLGMLVLPATVAAVHAGRGEVARRVAAGERAALLWPQLLLARVYAPMLAAFVAASPFVVLDARRFAHDFLRQNQIMGRGWLGFEHVGNGFWYNLTVNLGTSTGVVLLVLAVAGLAWALWRHQPVDVLLAPYVIVYFAYVSTWRELADRYLLPILPLVLLLAVRLCVDLVAQLRSRPTGRKAAIGVVAALLVGALVVPVHRSLAFDGALKGVDVRARAKAWVESNVVAGSVIASENYGPPLVARRDRGYYLAAGQNEPFYRLLKLSLPLPGVANHRHSIAWLRAHHADYVFVSSSVYDRVMAASADYPSVVHFYRRLAQVGRLVRVFEPEPGERGPVLKLYALSAFRRG
jgi:Dolichyl-phosphate-mannose-protein mannosyltransferase